MITTPCPIYVFRSDRFASSGDTVVSVAPQEYVASVYGAGGALGEDGLSSAFGGSVIFKNDQTGERFVGVWGARNASRFRSDIRAQMLVVIHKREPNARLYVWNTKKKRSRRNIRGEVK